MLVFDSEQAVTIEISVQAEECGPELLEATSLQTQEGTHTLWFADGFGEETEGCSSFAMYTTNSLGPTKYFSSY